MYYILYPFFYLLSLLPWRILYAISNGLYFIVYYLIGYRKEVVFKNLQIAFPEKTDEERLKIAKEFYKNFVDTFIETIKLITVTDKDIEKRCLFDATVLNKLQKTQQNIQFHTGHFFNWEFVNLIVAKKFIGKFIGVYMPLSNKAIDKIVYNMRSKYNTVLVSATEFKNNFHNYNKEPYALGLAIDQKPGNIKNAVWTNFFGKMTPFYTGPEKGAVRMNTAVILVNFYRIKRGFYKIDYEILTTNPRELPNGFITKKSIEYIEDCIKQRPANYLWSHRRWKIEFDEVLHGKQIL